MGSHEPPRSREDFDVAVICALQLESDAVEALFDEIWPNRYGKAFSDPNAYTLGRMGCHNTVLACLPGMGKESAASAASSLLASFPRIRLGLVVGVCGGVPFNPVNGGHVFLGDVIISTGVVQYDFGRRYSSRFLRKDTLDENIGRPTKEIRSFLRKMSGKHGRTQLTANAVVFLRDLCAKEGFEDWNYPGVEHDRLYPSTYRHKHQDPAHCDTCAACINREDDTCDAVLGISCALLGCDEKSLVVRDHSRRAANQPGLHFGHVASGDTVMKSALHRDDIASIENVVAFEMERAGVWDTFPTVVIKGVCDYADSHKMKNWQKYAAAAAAATMKAFLMEWAVAERLEKEPGPTQIDSNSCMSLNDLLRLEDFMVAVTHWQHEITRPSEHDSAVTNNLQRLMRQSQAARDGRRHQNGESSVVLPRSSMITAEQTLQFIHQLAENMHSPTHRPIIDAQWRDILMKMGSPSGTPRLPTSEPSRDRRSEPSISTLNTYQAMTAFDAFLKNEFQGRPGHQSVLRGDYMIVSGRFGGAVISRQEWLYTVEPGSVLTMAVSIGAWGRGGCPRCGGQMREVQLQCQICFQYCQMRRERREILDGAEINTFGVLETPSMARSSPRNAPSRLFQMAEIFLLKYIHYCYSDAAMNPPESSLLPRHRVIPDPSPRDSSNQLYRYIPGETGKMVRYRPYERTYRRRASP